MKTIWKFPLQITGCLVITMPEDAEILCVQVQMDAPYIWALVDPSAGKEPRSFRMFGTGHPIETGIDYTYIGTFQVHGGSLVFHLFEFKP